MHYRGNAINKSFHRNGTEPNIILWEVPIRTVTADEYGTICFAATTLRTHDERSAKVSVKQVNGNLFKSPKH
jgi:hypothetical protein